MVSDCPPVVKRGLLEDHVSVGESFIDGGISIAKIRKVLSLTNWTYLEICYLGALTFWSINLQCSSSQSISTMGESWEHMISLWDSNLTNHILPVFQESTPSKTIVASTDEH